MFLRTMIAAIALCAAASTANAEDCKQYPQGPFRFECASRNHPELLAKRERCEEEGRQMGLQRGAGKGAAGGLPGYVRACMQRR
jgi:hypothetical protein